MTPWGAVLAVASLAFRESARNRVLHALVGATLLAALCSLVFAWVAGGDADEARKLKIVADLSLSAISLLGTVASIFLGTNLIYQEVERRTVYTILSRPVGRGGFVLGKYLGLSAVLGVAIAAMGAGFLGIYVLAGGAPTGGILLALLFTYVELTVVIAVALFFSVAAHPIEGAVFSFVVALAGHSTASLKDLAVEVTRGMDSALGASAIKGGLYAIYVLLPNLENFNLRGDAVYGLPIDVTALAAALAYAVVYVAIMLGLSALVFRRRVL